MAAFDLSRNSDVKISQVTQLYSLFCLKAPRTEGPLPWNLNLFAQIPSNFNHYPVSLFIPDPLLSMHLHYIAITASAPVW